MQDVDVEIAAVGRRGRSRSTFFLVASILMTMIVFLGFMPSFFLRFSFRATPLPAYLVVHAVVMTAWQLLFLTQTILVAMGRTDLHRRIGTVGAGLALMVIVIGIDATLRQPAIFAARGAVLPFPIEMLVIGNIVGFATFGGFVAMAIASRRNTMAHRRLIYWACIVTVGPALTPGRSLGAMIAPYFPATFPPEIALGWIAWIALLLHDWLAVRRFHPVTVIGGMMLLFVGPALVDGLLQVDAVTAWARSPG